MASLKEVKERISTVRTTRKITQARQMVASAQLHRTQAQLARARDYNGELELAAGRSGAMAFAPRRPQVKKGAPAPVPAYVVLGASSGMCGAYNARVERALADLPDYQAELTLVKTCSAKRIAAGSVPPIAAWFPVGTKVRTAMTKAGITPVGAYDHLSGKPTIEEASALARELLDGYNKGIYSSVDVLYHDFRSVGSQKVATLRLLPLPGADSQDEPDAPAGDFLIEPSPAALAAALVPMLVRAGLWAALTSSAASEHASRMVAMQLASENADELLEELQLTYNKLRQQNITAQLLDIIGSSFA